ncbi:MAG: lactate utilization protein [Opitutales bacterium]|nr:lactate utilization protein [Opitutales bacterium]
MLEPTKTAIENFRRKGFKAEFFEDKNAALKYILDKIGSETVGIGGSMTIQELGWAPTLQARGEVLWHWLKKEPGILERENAAPVYITSANAISADGAIVNIDANGNRIAATAFGQKKVFIVAGENKIESDIPAALLRAKNVGAPLNAKRLARKTPCAIKGDKCYNCLSPERICRTTSIITFPPTNIETHIVLLSGSWGF